MFKMQWLPGVYVDDDAFEGGELLYALIESGEAGSGNAPTPATTGEAGSGSPPLTPSVAGAPPPSTYPAEQRIARIIRNGIREHFTPEHMARQVLADPVCMESGVQ